MNTAGASWPKRPSAITDEGLRALRLGARLATEEGEEIGLDHLLSGLLGVPGSAAVRALERAGVPAEVLRARAASGEPRGEPGPHASRPVRDVLEGALLESLAAHHRFTGTGHLLLGFTRVEEGRVLLRELGVDAEELRPHVLAALADHLEHRSLRAELPPGRL